MTCTCNDFFGYGNGRPNVLEAVTPCKRVYEDADDQKIVGKETNKIWLALINQTVLRSFLIRNLIESCLTPCQPELHLWPEWCSQYSRSSMPRGICVISVSLQRRWCILYAPAYREIYDAVGRSAGSQPMFFFFGSSTYHWVWEQTVQWMVTYDILEHNRPPFFKLRWVVAEGSERKANDTYCTGHSFCKPTKLIAMSVIVFMSKILLTGQPRSSLRYPSWVPCTSVLLSQAVDQLQLLY